MSYKQLVGLHVPLKQGLIPLINEVRAYDISQVQFFLSTTQRSSKITPFSKEEISYFIKQKESLSLQAYIHSSYWINTATGNDFRSNIAQSLLKKEIMWAKKLAIPYLVLHPGSATWHNPSPDDPFARKAGIVAVARILNDLLKREYDIKILLENTAHGHKTVGSDLYDLVAIRNLLDYPDRVGFCFDTAHAFSYGYDLSLGALKELLEATIGLDAIKLIHFNDSLEPQASRQDRHAFPGEGLIGKSLLQDFCKADFLQKIPKIIEVTSLSEEEIKQRLVLMQSW